MKTHEYTEWNVELGGEYGNPLDNLKQIRDGIEGAVVGGSIVVRGSDLIGLVPECRELEEMGVVSINMAEVTLKMNPSEALEIVDQYIQMEAL